MCQVPISMYLQELLRPVFEIKSFKTFLMHIEDLEYTRVSLQLQMKCSKKAQEAY